MRQSRISQHHREGIQQVLATVPFVLDKVVALGCGPLSLNFEFENFPTSQNALLLTLQSCIPRSKRSVRDPLYDKEDKHVLKSSGFHVLDDPGPFLIMYEASIPVSIRANVPIKGIVVSSLRAHFLFFISPL